MTEEARDIDVRAEHTHQLGSDEVAYQVEGGSGENQERERDCEHHGCFRVAALMAFQILLNYLVQDAIVSHNNKEKLQENELDIGQEQNRNESQSQDHHDQDEIDYEKE